MLWQAKQPLRFAKSSCGGAATGGADAGATAAAAAVDATAVVALAVGAGGSTGAVVCAGTLSTDSAGASFLPQLVVAIIVKKTIKNVRCFDIISSNFAV